MLTRLNRSTTARKLSVQSPNVRLKPWTQMPKLWSHWPQTTLSVFLANRMLPKEWLRNCVPGNCVVSLLSHVPDWNSIGTGEDLKFEIPSAHIYQCELNRYQQSIEHGNLSEVIARYPIRESSAFSEIAKELHFRDRKDYEKAFLTTILKDDDLADALRQRLGRLLTFCCVNPSTIFFLDHHKVQS